MKHVRTLAVGALPFDSGFNTTLYNLVVSFLLTAGHDTDGCQINTMLQLDEGTKIIFSNI